MTYPIAIVPSNKCTSPSIINGVGTREEMYVDGGTFKVKLSPGKAAAVSDYLGKEVIFGVRPGDIHDRQTERAIR